MSIEIGATLGTDNFTVFHIVFNQLSTYFSTTTPLVILTMYFLRCKSYKTVRLFVQNCLYGDSSTALGMTIEGMFVQTTLNGHFEWNTVRCGIEKSPFIHFFKYFSPLTLLWGEFY